MVLESDLVLESKAPAGGQEGSDFEEIDLDVELGVAGSAAEMVGEEHLGEKRRDVMMEG